MGSLWRARLSLARREHSIVFIFLPRRGSKRDLIRNWVELLSMREVKLLHYLHLHWTDEAGRHQS